MKKRIKTVAVVIIIGYVLLCISTHFTYQLMLNSIGNSMFTIPHFSEEEYLVFIKEDKVNFVKIKDVYLDLFKRSRIPIVSDRIIYDLVEPQKSTVKYNFAKETYSLDMNDNDDFLEKGLVVKSIGVYIANGTPYTKYVYVGVCQDKKKIEDWVSDSNIYYSEVLDKNYYLFMYESKDEMKFDGLYEINY